MGSLDLSFFRLYSPSTNGKYGKWLHKDKRIIISHHLSPHTPSAPSTARSAVTSTSTKPLSSTAATSTAHQYFLQSNLQSNPLLASPAAPQLLLSQSDGTSSGQSNGDASFSHLNGKSTTASNSTAMARARVRPSCG